jgi:hypothetical protein
LGVVIKQIVMFSEALNVPAVYDVWGGIKGLCEAKTAASLDEVRALSVVFYK